jgi:uncharacterized repeat protein (TIGR04076 family)
MVMNDEFELYDLEVHVEGDPSTFVCSHRPGLALSIAGENMKTLQENGFSFYTFSAILPLISVKQREVHKNDWINSDDLFACPDPHCGAKLRIKRTGKRKLKHSEVTKVPLKKEEEND